MAVPRGAKTKAKPATRSTKAKPSKAARPTARPRPVALAALLDGAREAASRGEVATALGQLLAAWRAVPAPALADAIDLVGARAMAGLEPPSGKTATARNAAWDAAAEAGDPAVRGVLLATLTETKGNAETLARLERLLPHRDPRTARRVADLVERPIYNVTVTRTQAFWKRIWPLLAELGDARVLARARTWPATWAASAELNPPERERLARRLEERMPALVEVYGAPPALSGDDAARCAAVVAALGAPRATPGARTEEELLAAIYAAPADDGARMVYADWLQERVDQPGAAPRGEFIALQLASGEPTREQKARQAALIAEFAPRWLGPLAKQLTKKSLVFERGFLVACAFNAQLDQPGSSHRFEFGLGIDTSPEWATVRDVTGGVPSSDACHVGELRVLREVRDRQLAHLATLKRPLAVEELHWEGPKGYGEPRGTVWERGVERLRAALPVLPRLRVLGLAPYAEEVPDLGWLQKMIPKLEELVVHVDVRDLPAWLARVRTTPLRRFELRWHPWEWRCVFERDARGELGSLVLYAPDKKPHESARGVFGKNVLEALEALPPTAIRQARVVATKPMRALVAETVESRLIAAFARQTELAAPVTFAPA